MRDLSRFAPTVRGLRLYCLYGAIAGGNAALAWADGTPITWKFWVSILVQVFTAWKALGTSSPSDQPHDQPIPTQETP